MGTVILIFMAMVVAAANVGARVVYRRKGFVAAALTFLGILILPFADAVPGYIAYRYYVQKDGGLQIYDSIPASGYLMSNIETCRACLSYLQQPYAYLEWYETMPLSDGLINRTGYVHMYVSEKTDPYCARFNRLFSGRLESYKRIGITLDQCVAVVYTDSPISEYEKNSRGPYLQTIAPPVISIRAYHVFVREIATGKIVAETRTYDYSPLIAKIIGGPEFSFGSVIVPMTQVLIPRKEEFPDDIKVRSRSPADSGR